VPAGRLPVVAAESFWGSLVSQLGGDRVDVYTIVSDPNADPHDDESTVADAVEVANARLVVENGAGYDVWCQKLVASGAVPGQRVLDVAQVLGKSVGDNPHFWYGATFLNASIAAMYSELVAADPGDRAYFDAQYSGLNRSLAGDVFSLETDIRAHFAGVEVASTESVFVYLASSLGLDLVSPPEFMTAVSEGNDPPISSVTAFQDQLESGAVRLLVYNSQTTTPLTTQLEGIAADHHVPTVPVTETLVPEGATFQSWMHAELTAIETALDVAPAGG